jgi:alcohol dehydrogenase (NADP+)
MFLLLSLLGSLAIAQQLSPATPPRGTQVDAVPILGIGTVQLKGNTSEVIAQAIVNGYRHIDCAWGYGNQKDIGLGIKEGLKRANLRREDLWITSKLWNTRSV